MKILLDTNFLLIPAQFKIDIFEELKKSSYKPITLDCCIFELKKLSKSRGRKGIYARVALQLLKKNKIRIINADEKNTDKAIIDYSTKNKYAVATNDKVLIKKLRDRGIKIVRLRQKRYLMED